MATTDTSNRLQFSSSIPTENPSNTMTPEISQPRSKSLFSTADSHRGDVHLDPNSDAMLRFTATGRAYRAPSTAERFGDTMTGMENAAHFSITGPANTLPMRFTDETKIPVPCLKLPIGSDEVREQQEKVGVEEDKKKKKKHWWSSSSRKSRDGGFNENFVIRQIPRGEYLKHYAKDEQGKYIGTEEPAADCMLRGEDLERWG